jgi:hypothetical protein
MTELDNFISKLLFDENNVDASLRFQHTVLNVPRKIELRDEQLIWNPAEGYIQNDLDKELLYTFANLAFTESQGILSFARTWGALGLCEHGLPATHNSPTLFPPSKNAYCEPSGSERIDIWQRFARISRAMLNIALRLYNDEQGRVDDWFVLLQDKAEGNLPKDIQTERFLLERAVNFWMDLANIRPRFRWESEGVLLEYPTYCGLFGSLAIQLMSNVFSMDRLLICSACGRCGSMNTLGGARIRRPRAGTRFYCADCVMDGAPQRFASQASRKRKRGH